MTDGRSADKVIGPARALRRLGVQLIALGVGRRYSMSQLIQIAHNRRHVFTAHFRALGSVATAIKRKVCKGIVDGELNGICSGAVCGLFYIFKE